MHPSHISQVPVATMLFSDFLSVYMRENMQYLFLHVCLISLKITSDFIHLLQMMELHFYLWMNNTTFCTMITFLLFISLSTYATSILWILSIVALFLKSIFLPCFLFFLNSYRSPLAECQPTLWLFTECIYITFTLEGSCLLPKRSLKA